MMSNYILVHVSSITSSYHTVASNLNRDHPLKGSLKKRMVLFERCIRYSEEHILPHHERQRTVKFSDQQDVQPQKHEEEEAQQQPPLQHESRDAEKDEEETEEEEDDEYEGFEIDYDFPPEQLLSAE